MDKIINHPKILKFTELYDDRCHPLTQFDGVKVILPDGREIFANRKYLNKLFKDSGYKGVNTVNSVYEIVGDTNAMDNLSIKDRVIAVNEDNFIYLYKESYYTIEKILDYIDENAIFVDLRGDIEDLTQFEVIFKISTEQSYVLQVNLVNEWAYLYSLENAVTHKVSPSVVASCNLYDENASDTIIDSITEEVSVNEVIPRDRKLTVYELTHILLSTGLIKWSGRKKMYISTTENEEIINLLVFYLELINTTSWKRRYITQTNITYGELTDNLSGILLKTIYQLLEVPFTISNYLWELSRIAKVITED